MTTLDAVPVQRSIRVTLGERGGDTFTLLRHSPFGTVTPRMGVQVDTTDSWVGYDYEAPLDVPVTYEAVMGAGGSVLAPPVSMPSNGSDWWVAISQPGLTRMVTVESFPSLTYSLAHGLVQPIASRWPIPVIQGRRSGRGTLTLLTFTVSEAGGLRTLIDRSPFFLFNGPPDRGLPDGGLYLLAADMDEQRTTRVAQDPARRFVISVIEVERPPIEVQVPEENTWQDWVDEGTTLAGWRERSFLDLLNEAGIGP